MEFIYRNLQHTRRSRALAELASQMGFSFHLGQDLSDHPFARLPLFSQPAVRLYTNIISGTFAGTQTFLFDYNWRMSLQGEDTQDTQVACFLLPGRWLPDFDFRPRSFQGFRISSRSKEIRFSTHPEFSRRYLLRGFDEQAVRRLFEGAPTDFFQSQPESSWFLQGGKGAIAVYWPEEYKEEEIPRFLQEASGVCAMLSAREDLSKRPVQERLAALGFDEEALPAGEREMHRRFEEFATNLLGDRAYRLPLGFLLVLILALLLMHFCSPR